jgi:phytoene dehydrogenase-like protein
VESIWTARCESIAQHSRRDADAYRAYVKEGQTLLPLLLKGYFTPPLPFAGFVGMLEQSPKGRRMVTDLFESAFDVLERTFESPKVKMHHHEVVRGAHDGSRGEGHRHRAHAAPERRAHLRSRERGGRHRESHASARALHRASRRVKCAHGCQVVRINASGGRARA